MDAKIKELFSRRMVYLIAFTLC